MQGIVSSTSMDRGPAIYTSRPGCPRLTWFLPDPRPSAEGSYPPHCPATPAVE